MNGLKHIAFIMDGNGRWAEQRGKNRSFGHERGARALEKIVSFAFSLDVAVLSFYAFSTENWSRPKREVDKILSLLFNSLVKNTEKLIKKQIRLVISGDLSVLDEVKRQKVLDVIDKTKGFDKVLNICFNYGGRNEILRAVNTALEKGLDRIDHDTFESLLYTNGLPPVDLVIRTSGEQRLSNFLLWQVAYAEMYFTPVLWPDFDEGSLKDAIAWYQERNRRFGGLK